MDTTNVHEPMVPLLSGEALAIPRTSVISSFIDSIGYDPDRKWLAISFRFGFLYTYIGVSEQVYEDFLIAPSKGHFYNETVRHHFALGEAGPLTDQPRLRSTSIRAIDYDPQWQVLSVEFGSDRVYRYHQVPGSVWDEFRQAENRSHYFNEYIADLYPLDDELEAAKLEPELSSF
jgi:hypothetical protein